MAQRDDTTRQDQQQHPSRDDRRGTVNPAENPRPSSPEAEADAVREGEEKLDRVKPY
jgi:hypothetical protein